MIIKKRNGSVLFGCHGRIGSISTDTILRNYPSLILKNENLRITEKRASTQGNGVLICLMNYQLE